MNNTTVLIADDHQIVRQGLRSLLDSHPDLTVVGEAADGREAIAKVKQLKPDVVVMDVGMPDLNGIDATRQVTAHQPAPQVVALSMHADRRFAGEMLRAGAKAYVLKESAFEELANAIREAVQGKVYLSPRVAGVVVEDYVTRIRDDQEEPNAFSRLSPREREVLQLM